MVKILLISHGNLCVEFLKTMTMIAGSIDDMEAIPLLSGDDMLAYKKAILEYISKDDKPTLVLTDLLGGSPFITATSIYRELNDKEKMKIVVGTNLPMLLELYNAKDNCSLSECVKLATATGRKGVADFEELMLERG